MISKWCYTSRFWIYRRFTNGVREIELGEVATRSYSYEELEKWTHNFKEEIGRGSFGTVYRGTIFNSQKVVAAKKLESI